MEVQSLNQSYSGVSSILDPVTSLDKYEIEFDTLNISLLANSHLQRQENEQQISQFTTSSIRLGGCKFPIPVISNVLENIGMIIYILIILDIYGT